MKAGILDFPKEIFSGNWKAGHVQGIAVDRRNGWIYYSFTTMIVKTDLQGRLIGWADGIVGHLGCMDFCEADGRVYASLEYKDDCIGMGILSMLGEERTPEVGFYIAVFDGAKITRPGMHAERDGIMTAVYLREVVADYQAEVMLDGKPAAHRHGCSGIDGLAFGPDYGRRDGPYYLNITYGVYGDVNRSDNDHQVILQYDISDWAVYERPLRQEAMHHAGPETVRGKYFVYTGNTEWGVQNYEYDESTGDWIMAVYRGKKLNFPNYPLFVVDGAQPARDGSIRSGDEMIPVKLLSLSQKGLYDAKSGIYGYEFDYGQTGLSALGGGFFYISENGRSEAGEYSVIRLYRWTGEGSCPFRPVK